MREIPSHIRRVYESKLNKRASPPSPPSSPSPPPENDSETLSDHPSSSRSCEDKPEEELEHYNMEPNKFGVFRQYTMIPRVDPETYRDSDTFINSPLLVKSSDSNNRDGICLALRGFGKKVASGLKKNVTSAFKNLSTFHIISWLYNGSTTKSAADVEVLVNKHLLAKDFALEELRGFRIATELKRLDNYDPTAELLTSKDGWKCGSISFAVPKEGYKASSEDDALTFTVKGLWYRPLTEIIRSAFQDPESKEWHLVPHKQFWKHPKRKKSPYYSPFPTTSNFRPLNDTEADYYAPGPSKPRRSARFKPTVEDVEDEYDIHFSSSSSSSSSLSGADGPILQEVDSDDDPLWFPPSPTSSSHNRKLKPKKRSKKRRKSKKKTPYNSQDSPAS